ncbi:beta-lactamase family protein [Exophiala viscosa]|uniref:Beta-lactamase family protein n=1 Tax=Exophiala viscosa TaxID=2486360 RepID=A0AAN6IGB2_9EURO|nr:beta-lactamase family protein [Exophiala viscosa]KAI1629953.1 beta-lactamase family protein [Exophiala viscosa]
MKQSVGACTFWVLLTLVSIVAATCHYHSPAFPAPDYGKESPELEQAFRKIESTISEVASQAKFDKSSYSIEVTSSDATLWSSFHTATEKDIERPGAEQINGSSGYRIASITKVFTVLGILKQHAAGNLSLDDTIDQYVSGLKGHQSGDLPWKDITLRSLASQLSGIPRDWAQGDLVNELKDPSVFGLPPITTSHLPKCDSYGEYVPCTEDEMLETIRAKHPLFAPNYKSTYSNIAFELLGLVLSNVTGLRYEKYIQQSILDPLGMNHTSFEKPSDEVAVLPKNISWYWDVDEGVQNPTGGLYATSSDLSKFLRYVLTHFNGITPALNWLNPVSFATSVYSYYGTPWEIFRTDKLLSGSHRPVTFVTKGGGLPGYRTIIMIVPEFELGITILTGGDTDLLDSLQEIVSVSLIQAADKLVKRQIEETRTSLYKASHINSSLELAYTEEQGLAVTKWISNGTDMLSVIPIQFQVPTPGFHLQLVPTLLYRDQKHLYGEIWRIALVLDMPASENPLTKDIPVWDDSCITDLDTMMYAGKPLNEVVFLDKAQDGSYETIELSAFRVTLTREANGQLQHDFLNTQEL